MSSSDNPSSQEDDGRTADIDKKVEDENLTPPQSKSSSRLGFEVKSRKKKSGSTNVDEEGGHRVTFTVTIAQAVPSVKAESEPSESTTVPPSRGSNYPASTADDEDGRSSRKKRIMEAPRAQNLYHLEYTLVPDDNDQTVKTDLVSFGVAAKIFTERQEAKVIKTWQEGDQTWVAWTHCHTVTLTEDLLKKMFTHTLELRVWDTRDKVGTRAKMDRPRAFKFPTVKGDDHTGGVKTLVIKQSKSFEKLQPKKSYIDRPLPSQPKQQYELDPIQLQLQKEAAKAIKEKKKKEKERLEGREGVPAKLNDYLDKAGHRIVDERKGGTAGSRVDNPDQRDYSRLSHLAAGSKPGSRERGAKSPGDRTKSRNKSPRGVSPSAMKPSSADSTKKAPVERQRSSTPRMKGKTDVPSHPPSTISSVKGDEPGEEKVASNNLAAQAQLPQTAAAAANPQQAALVMEKFLSAQMGTGGETGTTVGRMDSAGGPKKRDKKKEKEAQALAEHVKKHGKCIIPIRMAKFFAGMQTITERLEKPVDTIPDMFLSVSVNKPIMAEEQKRALNPLVIKVHSATNMPPTPLTYEELKLRCSPAYVKYKVLNQEEHMSVGRDQDKNIYWDDINVVLVGLMDHSELHECLSGPAMEIELHDRDRVPEKQKLKATLFGDDLEDEKISNVGTVASRRTIHNAFDGRDKPWDPYAVAKFDLSGLLIGEQVMHLQVPLHQCPIPDVLGTRDGKQDGKVFGVQGAVDGPVDGPLPPGHYLQNEAMMKIKVELAHPLITPAQLAAKQDLSTTAQCPFARMVLKFDYKNVKFLHKLQALITESNAKALGLEDMPAHIIEAALSTYKLSLEQQKSHNLDIVTGFQVLDSVMHMFVLEGLRENSIKNIWEVMPKPEESDVDILYNSELGFRERIYGPLDVDVCRIKLHEPLGIIVQQPLLYVRDMVPKPCFDALVKLEQLSMMQKLRDAWRSNLFPNAEMVVSMSREFGVPMTAEDFEELQPQLPKIKEETPMKMYEPPTTSRVWTPIDNYNDSYIDKLLDRQSTGIITDFEKENKELVREQSVHNKLSKSKTTLRAEVLVPHNYSSQSLNSTEQAKERLRQLLAQEDPDRRYTYCADYHHSMTVVPVNTEAIKKAEEMASVDQYKTPNGWVFPGRKTFIESNKHTKKPDGARVDELKMPWVENILHGKHRPVLERDRYKWSKRRQDLDIWTRPNQLFGTEPSTIHLAGQRLKEEKLKAAIEDQKTWKSKIVVDDTRSYFHRCATDTEMIVKGPKASNQIDRLRGLLKDEPIKHSLRKPGMAIQDIAPLNVVLNPSVDTAARRAGLPIIPAVDDEFDQKVKGLGPGPYEDYSWSLQKNVIPLRDYEHHKYKDARGQDFNVYHKERLGLHKRKAMPLSDEDYDTHLFYMPKNDGVFYDTYGNAFQLPSVRDFRQQQFQGLKGSREVTFDTMDQGLGSSINPNFRKEQTMV